MLRLLALFLLPTRWSLRRTWHRQNSGLLSLLLENGPDHPVGSRVRNNRPCPGLEHRINSLSARTELIPSAPSYVWLRSMAIRAPAATARNVMTSSNPLKLRSSNGISPLRMSQAPNNNIP